MTGVLGGLIHIFFLESNPFFSVQFDIYPSFPHSVAVGYILVPRQYELFFFRMKKKKG